MKIIKKSSFWKILLLILLVVVIIGMLFMNTKIENMEVNCEAIKNEDICKKKADNGKCIYNPPDTITKNCVAKKGSGKAGEQCQYMGPNEKGCNKISKYCDFVNITPYTVPFSCKNK